MEYAFDLMSEVVINGTRRHGVISDRKYSDQSGVPMYVVFEPTLKSTWFYEDEISPYGETISTASGISPDAAADIPNQT